MGLLRVCLGQESPSLKILHKEFLQKHHRKLMTEMTEYKQDGPEAARIASVIPWYPFHGVPRFYDISGMTQDPEAFQVHLSCGLTTDTPPEAFHPYTADIICLRTH
jgi:hypothetical protein